MKIKHVALAVPACFLLLQAVRPGIENPIAYKDKTISPTIKPILQKSCYDCHSNEPQLKWFDHITPGNFLVADHITKARASLNFSYWDTMAADQQKNMLVWAVNDVCNREMPLNDYLLLHPAAKISEQDITVLKQYLSSITKRKQSDSTDLQAVVKQQNLALQSQADKKVQVEWNGLTYIRGWEHWTAISTTDRFDNNSIRVIYGNDVAVKAIQSGTINPWPDGTIFAKAAWKDQNIKGRIVTGEFWQVEFMVKDHNKYAKTGGWGWGRWRGLDLKPYGKNAMFAQECMTCHRPVQPNDLVFTYPFHLQNK